MGTAEDAIRARMEQAGLTASNASDQDYRSQRDTIAGVRRQIDTAMAAAAERLNRTEPPFRGGELYRVAVSGRLTTEAAVWYLYYDGRSSYYFSPTLQGIFSPRPQWKDQDGVRTLVEYVPWDGVEGELETLRTIYGKLQKLASP